MIPWSVIAKVALAAAQAYVAHLQGRKNEATRLRDRELIQAAVQRALDEILDRLNVLEVNQLRGELEGFQLIYGSYNPDPNDTVEEGRLVSLIDDSARVLGRLGAHLDAVGGNPELAFEAWGIYVPLLYVRAQAMNERQVTYGANETKDALESFDMALPRLVGLLSYLRGQSDSRFGPVVCRPMPDSQDSRVCWYRWGHSQFICGSTRDPQGVAKCQDSRARNMDRAYRAVDGVREIQATKTELQDARDTLDTISALDILTNRGVDVGEVVMVPGGLARSIPDSDASQPAGNTRSLDWFS